MSTDSCSLAPHVHLPLVKFWWDSKTKFWLHPNHYTDEIMTTQLCNTTTNHGMHYDKYVCHCNLPSATTWSTLTCCFSAMKPRIEKTTKPANRLVPQLMSVTITASLQHRYIHTHLHSHSLNCWRAGSQWWCQRPKLEGSKTNSWGEVLGRELSLISSGSGQHCKLQ